MQEFRDVFGDNFVKGRPAERDLEHTIESVSGSKPLNHPPYRLAFSEQVKLEVQVKGLLTQEFTSSSAPYGAPIMFVPRMDGRWRTCI